jgi:hypothetical protein
VKKIFAGRIISHTKAVMALDLLEVSTDTTRHIYSSRTEWCFFFTRKRLFATKYHYFESTTLIRKYIHCTIILKTTGGFYLGKIILTNESYKAAILEKPFNATTKLE